MRTRVDQREMLARILAVDACGASEAELVGYFGWVDLADLTPEAQVELGRRVYSALDFCAGRRRDLASARIYGWTLMGYGIKCPHPVQARNPARPDECMACGTVRVKRKDGR